MKIFKCVLEPHDFLFFASRDLAKIGVTEKIIHSTALNYAINHTSRIISFSSQPDYNKDIGKFPLRVTPAHPLNTVSEIGFSYNAVNDLDISTDAIGNYPTVGKYYKINIGTIETIKGNKSFKPTNFEFFTFSYNDLPPRRVIRLGKKENYCVVHHEELKEINVTEAKKDRIIKPSHPVNPLEFDGRFAVDNRFPISILSIPPHHLIMTCGIESGWYLEAKDKENKVLRILPPKDKIKEILEFYGNT